MTFLLFAPTQRDGEEYTIGIGFEEGDPSTSQIGDYLIEEGTPGGSHTVCGSTVGEERHSTSAQVTVGGVNDHLHRGLNCIM